MTRRLFAMALAACAATGPAHADQPLWEAGLGAGWLRLPHYRGSDETHSWLLPVPYFVYHGKFLRADRDGARAVLIDAERFDFDLSLGASPPTKSDHNRAREGMPDLKPSFEVGPKLNLNLGRGEGWKLDLRVPMRAVMTIESKPRYVGWNLEPVVNADLDLGGWNVGLQAGPMWGDRRLHQTTYGVEDAYATATRPAYAAPGGYAGWQATAGFSRRIGRLWMGAYLRHDSVGGAAFEPSPLVKSRSNTAAGFALSWIFAESDARVPDER